MQVIGNPAGLAIEKPIRPPGKAGTFVFVKFQTEDARDVFIKEKNKEGLPGTIFLKPNKSSEECSRGKQTWQMYKDLEGAGLKNEQVTTSGKKIFTVDADGNATHIGTFGSENVEWLEHAPERVRNA